jgi:hypothetical protein
MPNSTKPDYRKISTFEELQEIAAHDPGHLVLAYVKLQLLEQYFLKGNSKKHDLQLIKESIYEYGFKMAMRYSSGLTNIAGNKGAIQGGNGRLETLL